MQEDFLYTGTKEKKEKKKITFLHKNAKSKLTTRRQSHSNNTEHKSNLVNICIMKSHDTQK